MDLAVKEQQCVADLERCSTSPEEAVRSQVCGLLGTLYPRGNKVERRGEQRFPFPYLVHLTPVESDDTVNIEGTVVVAGKHISERGLGFYHQQPLPNRRMIVSLEVGSDAWLGFLIDLTWCRFTKQGWYESGGRFLQVVNSPIEA